VVSAKYEIIFIKSQYEMLKLAQHLMHKVGSNYNNCTSRSNENICTSSRGAKEKERQGETQFTIKIGGKISLGPHYFVL
jgi:hypothetical protein